MRTRNRVGTRRGATSIEASACEPSGAARPKMHARPPPGPCEQCARGYIVTACGLIPAARRTCLCDRACVRACSGIRLAVSACVTCWFLAIRMSLSKRSGAEGCVYLLVFANEQLGVQILSTIRVFLWQRLDWRIELDLLSKLGKFSIRLVHFCLHKQFV